MVEDDLIREAASLPDKDFKNKTDELHFNLVRAEQHARQALDVLYSEAGPKRSLWFRMVLGRAQSILMSLYKQELGRRP